MVGPSRMRWQLHSRGDYSGDRGWHNPGAGPHHGFAMKTTKGYAAAQIALHWLVGALVVFNYFYSSGMGRALAARLGDGGVRPPPIEPLVHVWVGLTVLALVVLRLLLRRFRGAPEAPGTGMARTAAIWGHRLLYTLLAVVPVLGTLAWFGGLRTLGDPHEVLANVLVIVAGGHALMALVHHYVWKDGTLARMLRPE